MDKLNAYLSQYSRVKLAVNLRQLAIDTHKVLKPIAGPAGTIGMVGLFGSMAIPVGQSMYSIYQNEKAVAARGKQWRAEAARMGIPYQQYKAMMKSKGISLTTPESQYTQQ